MEDKKIDEQKIILEEKKEKEEEQYKRYKLVSLLLLIILLTILLVVNKNHIERMHNNKDPSYDEVEEMLPVEDPVPDEEKKYELVVYYSNGEYKTEKENETDIVVATIPTETLEAEYLHITRHAYNEENYHVLYKDNNKIKIYDVISKTSTITALNPEHQKYEFIFDQRTNEIYGIAYYSDIIEGTSSPVRNTSGFFNIKTGRILYRNLYDVFYYVDKDKIAGKNTIDTGTTEQELLSLNEEKSLTKVTGKNNDYFEIILGDYIAYNHQNKNYINLYTSDGKLIVEDIAKQLYIYDDVYNISFIKNNKVEKYTPDGVKIAESKEYDRVLQLIKDFHVVVINGKLVLTNYNDMELILGEWDDSYTYYFMESGFYEKSEFGIRKEEGIYIYIDTNLPEIGGFQYYFNIDTKELKISELPQTNT